MSTPFVYRMPVRFADVDHAGIVYYPTFFHYFHQTFEEFFRDRLGASAYAELLDVDKVGFPAVSSKCDYRAPLRFGDEVEIEMRLARLGKRSITLRYDAFRLRENAGERVLAATGEVTSAVVDLVAFRAIPTPPRLEALFRGLGTPAAEP